MTGDRRLANAVPMVHGRKPLTRLVARRTSALLNASALRWAAFGFKDYVSGVMVEVVLSASISQYPYRDPGRGTWIGVDMAVKLARPVSAAGIAQSMRLPASTVARHAAALVQAGVFARGAAGYTLAAQFFEGSTLAEVSAGDAADLVATLEALAEAGYEPAARALKAGLRDWPDSVVERLLLSFGLRALETFTELYGDFTGGTISAAIIAANVRTVTEDHVLSRQFAAEENPPPDAMRIPVALRPLARSLSLPFETVRRRVAALVADGTLVWKDGGVIVPSQVLLSDLHLDNNRRIQVHFEQMLATIVSLGQETGTEANLR